ncbi:hypothetical protein M093_2276 [Bacteroides uniformis str. 3978 T3 i]|uniref:Uncharacterized protein n=1 Tax=Bacteroides uniformis str. 3978 T3 ii TaxID=1339349 RepID=A0A078RZ55_BACUN|nr:hypothetical protein M094_1536 [Bacteroides uniformis str. 3978 T3 ii]KDS61423.1 hypothetical protein M093_2276 [Bacteroides uniformis str. 3978 T3 i]
MHTFNRSSMEKILFHRGENIIPPRGKYRSTMVERLRIS